MEETVEVSQNRTEGVKAYSMGGMTVRNWK